MERLDSFERNGATYWSLWIQCPVCYERGINTGASLWNHSSCGGDIYIGDNAHWYCKNCGGNGPMMELKYKCPTHSTVDDEYVGLTGGATTLASVISCAGQLTGQAGITWLQKFLSELRRQ